MPEQEDVPGGTQGANSALARWLSHQYQYSVQDLDVIRQYWSPSEDWVAQYDRVVPLAEIGNLPEEERAEWEALRANALNGRDSIERFATDFMAGLSTSRGKATPVMQKLYLQKIISLTEELSYLLLAEPSVTDTPADLFALLRRRWGGNKTTIFEMEMDFHLRAINMIATGRLRQGLTPEEEPIHTITRKDTYERFKFASGAISFYEHSTGKTATAWVNETPEGQKHSEAIGFLMAVMNPVLQAAGYPPISADSARKEIQEIKKAFGAGLAPHMPRFGSGMYPGT